MKLDINYIQHDIESWKRLLEYLRTENAFQKIRLADVIRNAQMGNGFLQTAEDYQDKFIQEEQVISLLRKDATDIDRLLVKENYLDGRLTAALKHNYKRLRHEFEKLELESIRLRHTFRNFVDEHINP